MERRADYLVPHVLKRMDFAGFESAFVTFSSYLRFLVALMVTEIFSGGLCLIYYFCCLFCYFVILFVIQI